MKTLIASMIIAVAVVGVLAQDPAQKIYETERAFEKMVTEKGINAGFVEYLSPAGIMFMPDAVNGRQTWKARPLSPASLSWNPIKIDVSSNGVLAYSIGNSMFRPKGKEDPDIFYGHYISIWMRQPNGEYRAALDTGINHDKPDLIPTEWKPEIISNKGPSEAKSSAGDHSAAFYIAVDNQGAASAYNSYLANDAIVMRDGLQPFFGRSAAVAHLKKEKGRTVLARRKSFIEAGDLAYVNSTYKLGDPSGAERERGNFVQVWKLIDGKWKIVADVYIPVSKSGK